MELTATMWGMCPTKKEPTRKLGPLAVNLRRTRIAAGMTQERLAKSAGVSRGTIATIESGGHANPGRVTLDALTGALGITSDALLGRAAATPGVSETGRSTKSEETSKTSSSWGDLIERHRSEIDPRAIEPLERFAHSLAPGAAVDEQVFQHVLSAIRRQLAIKDGII